MPIPESRNDLLDVHNTNVVISQATERVRLYLRNSSTGGQVITINLGYNEAVALQGIVLKAGDSFVDSNSGNYQVWQGVITAIGSAANGKLSIMEG